MPQISAGILLHRPAPNGTELLLAHPGGPFWARKDAGAWTIPKGLVEAGEAAETAARREFAEETGLIVEGPLSTLGEFRQPGGKIVVAFAMAGDLDPARLTSNSFELEWPPRSGRVQSFPEIDRLGWFNPEAAREKLLKGQVPIIDALLRHVAATNESP